MANADQILSLIRSHIEKDDNQFHKIALQISAVEAKAGHAVLARSIQELVKQKNTFSFSQLTKSLAQSAGSEFLLPIYEDSKLSDLILEPSSKEQIKRIILEFKRRNHLRQYNLDNRKRILLYGPSGTGKTMTASVIANEIGLNVYLVRSEKLITKFMGETSQNLAQVFDFITNVPAVYLFDEFDTLGTQRGNDNEVGEQRRILNTFLQLLDRGAEESIVLAATNNIDAIDKALFRRFDDVIKYELPSLAEITEYVKYKFCQQKNLSIPDIAKLFEDMSLGEIQIVCSEVLKESILYNVEIDEEAIKKVISQRVFAYKNIV
jgi:SpoVK/Ycf46/Vps4 family AAA+-type ATPase